MSVEIKSPKKLIEVALPLEAINTAAALEKQPFTRRHPRSLHIWWARRPFTTARAVLFAQLVNDPGFQQGNGFRYGKNKKEAELERKRLFGIIEDLCKWENTNNQEVLAAAKSEILRSWQEICEINKDHPSAKELFDPERPPAFHDPFAGGGALPIEAQRLGLESYGTDLNPVAVLLNKAMIELPSLFSNRSPIGPKAEQNLTLDDGSWPGALGMMEDVRRYGLKMYSEAKARIGHFYPSMLINEELVANRPELNQHLGQELQTIGWLWARTVRSPNPAFSHVHVPLVSTFVLSSKEGKEVYIRPIVQNDKYTFEVVVGEPPKELLEGTKANGRGANFKCILSGVPISGEYIKSEGQAGRLGQRQLAVVCEGRRQRVFLSPTTESETPGSLIEPIWQPDVAFLQQALGFRVGNYGMTKWSDLFTKKQLLALSTFCEILPEIRETIYQDAISRGFPGGDRLEDRGTGARAYSEAICVYIALAISRWADLNNTACTWNTTNCNIRALFSRQAISMTWDFFEVSAFGPMAGLESIFDSYCELAHSLPASKNGFAEQADAQKQTVSTLKVISTDPPYYDNIGYADLSDFFYVWLKHSVGTVYPKLFADSCSPKMEELVATPARHGGKIQAEEFFLSGMTKAMHALATLAHPEPPLTIYYAFKQSETDNELGTSSTGWVTFLEAVITAGFQITGTWPIRTERESRSRGIESNALASSILLVCRKRNGSNSSTISRREFVRELNQELPNALDEMIKGTGDQRSPVAPVDLSQAIIGPGMAIYSKYTAVLEADGNPMSVKTALQLINRFLSQDDFDNDTQFCMDWFNQYGWAAGRFGEADVLARAKGTSVDSLCDSGILFSAAGEVRLFKAIELNQTWQPKNNHRVSIWEVLHQMICSLAHTGESGAGAILAQAGQYNESARTLAYRLYTLCERKGWAQDSSQYDQIVRAWDGIETAARSAGYSGTQISLFSENQHAEPEQISKKKKTRKKKS
jgi:putative DNA methylase